MRTNKTRQMAGRADSVRGSCRWRLLPLLALLLLPLQGRVLAAGLPAAEEILGRYVEATGGAAYDQVRNRVTVSKVEVAGAGVVLDLTLVQAKPDSAYLLVESDYTGRIETGCQGDLVWEISALRGPQLKEGAERDDLLHLNTIDCLAQWKERFREMKCTATEEVAGRPCYRIEVMPKRGTGQILFIDMDTYLLRKLTTTVAAGGNRVLTESYPSDYRRVDGILLPFRNVIHLLGQERIATVQSIQHNVELPNDRFALPAEIKALVDKG